jgi:hypothetical protein
MKNDTKPKHEEGELLPHLAFPSKSLFGMKRIQNKLSYVYICTNYKFIYLSHPILLTCPILMLFMCFLNNPPPPYFKFCAQTLEEKKVFSIGLCD